LLYRCGFALLNEASHNRSANGKNQHVRNRDWTEITVDAASDGNAGEND